MQSVFATFSDMNVASRAWADNNLGLLPISSRNTTRHLVERIFVGRNGITSGNSAEDVVRQSVLI